MSGQSVSIVIPAFNSGEHLQHLIDRIADQSATGLDIEIVVANDASTDDTPTVLRTLSLTCSALKVVSHLVNRGQGAATLSGIRAASHDVIVTIDDDLQHDTRDIPRLLAGLARAGPQGLAIGVRDRARHPLWREALSVAANVLSNVFLAKSLPLRPTAFCAFHKQLCAGIDGAGDVALVTALVQAATFVIQVPLTMDSNGPSRYGARALCGLFIRRVRYFSRIRIALWLAGCAGAWMLTRR